MKDYNTIVINEIIRHSQGKINPVDYLMKMFSVSKETAYRRIRNVIPFSIEEIVAIAEDINLSIDQMLASKSGNNFPFNKNLNVGQEPVAIYSDLIREDIEIMEGMLASKDVKITAAMNSIPFRFLPYQSLFKLDYCHYIYSTGKISLMTVFSDIEVPPAVGDLHDKAVSCYGCLKDITCVVDNMLFSNTIKKIQYYRQLKFISDDDLRIFQAELFELLGKYDGLLRNGKNGSGAEYVFYYSFFNLESNIIFLEYDNNTALQMWIYPESPVLIKNNALMNDIQKKWIDSKIRNSKLITKTTDVHQIEMLREAYRQTLELMPQNPAVVSFL